MATVIKNRSDNLRKNSQLIDFARFFDDLRASAIIVPEMVRSQTINTVGPLTDIRRKKMMMFQRFLAFLACLIVAMRLPEGVSVLDRPVRPPEMDELEWHDRAVSNKKRRLGKR